LLIIENPHYYQKINKKINKNLIAFAEILQSAALLKFWVSRARLFSKKLGRIDPDF